MDDDEDRYSGQGEYTEYKQEKDNVSFGCRCISVFPEV